MDVDFAFCGDFCGDHACHGRRQCRMILTPAGCDGLKQSTWPRTDHSGGCWRLVVSCTRSGTRCWQWWVWASVCLCIACSWNFTLDVVCVWCVVGSSCRQWERWGPSRHGRLLFTPSGAHQTSWRVRRQRVCRWIWLPRQGLDQILQPSRGGEACLQEPSALHGIQTRRRRSIWPTECNYLPYMEYITLWLWPVSGFFE